MDLKPEIEKKLTELKVSSQRQGPIPTAVKNKILIAIAEKVKKSTRFILEANAKDIKKLKATATPAFRDRLTLNPARIAAMCESLLQVSELVDPVDELIEDRVLPNGLRLKKVRAPLGIIFMIFEARPNVILEAFSLAFKSGNSIILRGGSDSAESSQVIYHLIEETLNEYQLQGRSFFGIQNYDHQLVECLLKRNDLIDVVIPRGGDQLIQFVQKTALMPIIKNDRGLCHTFVAEDANLEMAVNVVSNAKTQRPGVCNSLETVLVHESIAEKFLPVLYEATKKFELSWYLDAAALKILKDKPRVTLASEENWNTEYLDLKINCRIVPDLEQALQHIGKYGSKHSEAIITSSEMQARVFQNRVDAAAVYWNASTRFTDGFEFGLGGELGISTQKLHVRGPVGLRELTTPRWLIEGQGQIRN